MTTQLNLTRQRIEAARDSDFSRLEGQVYLDHAGAAQYPTRLLQCYLQDIDTHLYSNPHSSSLSGTQVADIIQSVRCKVLQHFNTTSEEYEVVFTSGCTSALKLLAEGFDFGLDHVKEGHSNGAKEEENDNNVKRFSEGGFYYLNDNHTSVMGMREVISQRGGIVSCFTEEEILKHWKGSANKKEPLMEDKAGGRKEKNSLFAFPAQSNFCGRRYPLGWIDKIQGMSSSDNARNYVLLDAACFVTSSKLDMNEYKPDFVSLSFYKMFGFPTGLGALLVKKESSKVLKKTYFGGGTVKVAIPKEDFHVSKDTLSERFEDGTVNYLGILALRHAFQTFYDITGGPDNIAEYVFLLTKLLFQYLRDSIHINGTPVSVIYSDSDFDDPSKQGPIIAFNVLRSNGEHVGFSEISKLAQLYNIHLRTGCFCNLGGCQRHLKMSNEDVKKNFQQGHVCGDDVDLVDGLPTGALRVSLGYSTGIKDIRSFIQFMEDCFVEGGNKMNSVAIKDYVESMWHNLTSSKSLVSNGHPTIPFKSVTKVKNSIGAKSQERLDVEPVEGSKPANNSLSDMPTTAHVSRIIVYPVKSCGAFVTFSWKIGPRGLLYDREWMVVDSSGINMSQKKCPLLVHITPKIDLQKGLLTLSYPGMESISVLLEGQPQGQVMNSQMTCMTPVCRDTVKGQICDLEVSEWLQKALGTPGLQLVHQDPNLIRTAKRKPLAGQSGSSISLANESQYLLISESSVKKFHSSMMEQAQKNEIDPDSVPSVQNLIARFRANLIIAGNIDSYKEETWKTVTIENTDSMNTFNVQGGCKRCQVICTDQSTGERQKDVFRTLSAVTDRKVTFGILMNNADMDGIRRISVGDIVTAETID